MATGNKQAGEWMGPEFDSVSGTMKIVADLWKSKPHGPDDTRWIEDDVGLNSCKPSDLRKRGECTGG
jgi:hypothetical protein